MSAVDALAGPIEALLHFLEGRRFVALTGAGCSTESGIPDYRGPSAKPDRRPLLLAEFVARAAVRRRYWARSFVGYDRIHAARPNPAHRALAQLEAAGALTGVITQNVDRLHDKAGSRRVIELHGALHEVVCLGCGAKELRASVQSRLARENADWSARAAAPLPDGDVELSDEDVLGFRVVDCERCGGVLKPDVVLFGEGVPRPRVEAALAWLAEAERLLVVGSSLAVFSGFRFVRRANELGIPIAIVNLGPTRGDPHARLRLDAAAGAVLPLVARAVTEKTSPSDQTAVDSRP